MIQDLDNNEISHAYYLICDYIRDVDDALRNGMRMKRLELDIESSSGPMSLQPIVVIRISDDEAQAVRESHHYLTCKSIINKLKPIIELIEEVQPEIKEKYDNNE